MFQLKLNIFDHRQNLDVSMTVRPKPVLSETLSTVFLLAHSVKIATKAIKLLKKACSPPFLHFLWWTRFASHQYFIENVCFCWLCFLRENDPSCCKDRSRSGLCHCVSLCAGKIGSISHFHCPLAFYHVLCGHKGRENPDIVNSQSLRGRKRPRLSWDRHKIYGLSLEEGVEFALTRR